MATRTVALHLVMRFMAAPARGHTVRNGESHGCHVAAEARHRMSIVAEADGSEPGRVPCGCHRDLNLARRGQFGCGMAHGTIASRRSLVMADLATARCLESQFALLGRRIVTGSAGELFMPVVLKAVHRDGWKEPRRRIGYIRRRIALSPRLPSGRGWAHRLLHRFAGVERARRGGGRAL